MPEPPDVSFFSRYVLENPWPLGGLMLAAAIVIAWTGFRDGLGGRLKVAGVLLLVGAGVLIAGLTITTAAEHGEATTRDFVEKVVANDLTGALAMFTDDATFGVGSPNNPGFDLDFFRRQLDRRANYTITSNSISMLDGYAESGTRAIVHLECFTEAEQGYAPLRTQWAVTVVNDPVDSDRWRIQRLTWIKLGNQEPRL